MQSADRQLSDLRRTARMAIAEGTAFDKPFVLSNLAAGQSIATAVVRSPVRFTKTDVAAMEKRLPRAPDGSPVRLTLRHVEVDIVGDGG